MSYVVVDEHGELGDGPNTPDVGLLYDHHMFCEKPSTIEISTFSRDNTLTKNLKIKGAKMSLAGKVAIVTGAARGIGRGIVLALAKEGAKVGGIPGGD